MRPVKKFAPGSAVRVIGANAIAKVVVMGVSGALAVITTRLIIQYFGVDPYAQYGLLTSMAALVPFADLGMSAAVINVVASSKSPRSDDVVRRTLVSAFRVLLCSAATLAAIGVLITVLGLWPALLGQGLLVGGSVAAMFCVLIFSVTLPLGVGQRVLTGLGKNHIQILTQALAAPFILIVVVVLIALGAQADNFLAVVAYLASTLVALTALLVAAKYLSPQISGAIRMIPRVRTYKGVNVMSVAWPMLMQMLALPIALQTDRLLLSHLGTSAELAQYNLGSQLFGLITQTIAASAVALWPMFAKARSADQIRSPFKLAGGFVAGGFVLAMTLASILPWVTPLISDGKIELDNWLVFGFVGFVVAQAAKYPLGMYMTDLRGLRFQVIPIILMVPVNLGLSWVLISPLGAAGPIIGSAIAVTLFQVIPNYWYIRRDMHRRRRSAKTVELNTGPIPSAAG